MKEKNINIEVVVISVIIVAAIAASLIFNLSLIHI